MNDFLKSSLRAKDYILKAIQEKEQKFNEDYYYLALYLTGKNKEDFLELQDLIKDEDIYTEDTFGREEKPHVTVFYGLKEDKKIEIQDYMKTLPPAKIKLGEISYFRNDNKNYDVMIVEIIDINKSLFKVHDHIKNNYRNDWSYPEYAPHATIAYVKKDKGDLHEDNHDMYGKEFLIKDLTYIDSNQKQHILSFGG